MWITKTNKYTLYICKCHWEKEKLIFYKNFTKYGHKNKFLGYKAVSVLRKIPLYNTRWIKHFLTTFLELQGKKVYNTHLHSPLKNGIYFHKSLPKNLLIRCRGRREGVMHFPFSLDKNQRIFYRNWRTEWKVKQLLLVHRKHWI